jgi:hypothetical protein
MRPLGCPDHVDFIKAEVHVRPRKLVMSSSINVHQTKYIAAILFVMSYSEYQWNISNPSNQHSKFVMFYNHNYILRVKCGTPQLCSTRSATARVMQFCLVECNIVYMVLEKSHQNN